jgi:hypothetical protein
LKRRVTKGENNVSENLILLAGLGAAFEVFTDEQDAVDSFFPDRVALKYDILEFVKKEEEKGSSPEPES